ncbi:MAG TPA: type II toxin-antitoxin system VapC family toxin [Acidobacteriaceae bacterium]|nr:type II toxin-antitoxin system VapC family toxin [Acidobacteriaceae bacterium]
MTLYLLDTNTIRSILKDKSPAARARLDRVGTRKDHDAAISSITLGEILYGLEKIGAGLQRRKAVELFFSTITICSWDQAAAEAYGHLRARQEARGKTLGPNDLQIAAHALALGAILVSHDRAFRHVTGLAGLEDWSTDQ